MSTDKPLIARCFSFFSSHSYGYETQKELRPDNQALIFDFEHHFKTTSAIKNGYSVNNKSSEMNLGNLTKKIKLNLSGARKTKKLIESIEKRIDSIEIDTTQKEEIQYILIETKEFIKHGEWFVGFEIMVSNLDEINFKITTSELILVKEIFQKAKVDWKKDWSWIENLKEA